MKYKSIVFVSVFLIILLAGVVFATEGKNNSIRAVNTTDKVNDKNLSDDMRKYSNGTARNITFGQCVSENAKLKDVCYKSAKDVLKNCKTQTNTNSSDKKSNKNAVKRCDQTYKKDLTQCKVVFKESKNECRKIKHNFMESFRASLE